MRPLVIALVALGAATPALAQTERLPLQSRSERNVQDINRSLARDRQITRENQQTQFEINQLRNEIRRPSFAPGVSPGCPVGSIGC